MAKSNHNKYVSYPDWFGSSTSQPAQQQQVTQTIYYGSGGSSSSSGGTGLTGVITQGSGNAVTSGTLDGTTLVLNKDLTFLTDQSENTPNLWELRYTADGTAYLYANYDIVTLGGHTMYADQGTIDVPGLYDGLPIDYDTIYWAETDKGHVLKAKTTTGGSNGTSVSADYILSIVSNAGYITESWIDQQDFINAASLNDALLRYVTLDTNQPITGIKDFKNGLLIDGTAIKSYQGIDKTIYIDGNLVVKGGLTMFAGSSDLDLPNIYEGLPIDNVTIYWEQNEDGEYVLKSAASSEGGGTVDKIDWQKVYNKPEWITDSKPIYQYSEIKNTPDLTVYATTTSLNDLTNIVSNKADKATTLAGYGITDAYTKTKIDELLNDYVTLNTYQIITGKKDFTTGGLFINGKQIHYNTSGKYWKLEGDLLITGGLTQYGNDSSFVPSTIMDGIVTDEKTISKQKGYLEVIGGTSSGGNIEINDATYTTKGIASFNSSSFTVNNGAVDLKTKVVVTSTTPSSFNSNTLYIIT